MMQAPDFLRGRRAAVSALALACAAALLLVTAPLYAMFAAQNSETEDSLHALGVYRAELAGRSELEKQLSDAQHAISAAPGLVSATSVALAESQVQGDMKTLVESHGGEVRSAQILPSTKKGNLDVLSIQYDLAVPATKLRALVYAVETHAPYLFIDDADLLMPRAYDPQVQDAPEPKFDIRWTIHAYKWRNTP